MRTAKVYVEAKRSSNFQTYTVGLEIELDKGSVNEVLTDNEIREIQTRCRKLANEQIELDKPRKVI